VINDDHNFFLVSSSRVFLDKSLSFQSRFLFTILSSLTKKEGYCYASNQYLAELMDSSDRSIQRWLEELKEKKYIEVHLWKEKMRQKRAINIHPGFAPYPQKDPNGNLMDSKNFYGTNEESSWARQVCHPRNDSCVTHNINSNIIEIEKNNISCSNTVHNSQLIENEKPAKYMSTMPSELKKTAADAALASDDAHEKKNLSLKKKFEKIDEELCEEMLFKIQEQCPTFKDPRKSEKTWNAWLTEMNRIRRIDNRDTASIRQIMKFIYNDEFWCKNILSPKKLRTQYDNLWMRAFGPQKSIHQNKKTAHEAIQALKTIDKDTLIINHSSCHDSTTGKIFSLAENPDEFRKKIMSHFHLKEDHANRFNKETDRSSYRSRIQ
jgi:hypothetical protein